jgi:hypothetical protein
VAKEDVVIDQGWDLLSFAGQASALTSGNVELDTLPVKGYGKIDGLDVDVIDIPQVQAVVHTLFMPPRSASPAPTAATTTAEHPGVDVHNGHPQWFGPDGAGGKLAGALTARGFARGQTATIGAQDSSQASTARVPGATPGNPAGLPGGLPTSASPVAPAGHVVVYTGHGFTMPGSVQGGSTTAQADDDRRSDRGPSGWSSEPRRHPVRRPTCPCVSRSCGRAAAPSPGR